MPALQRRWNSTQAEKVGAGESAEGATTATPARQAQSYPFSDSVTFPTQTIQPKQKDQPYSVMDRTNQALILPTTASFRNFFRKNSPERIPTGSVISVETHSGGATPATSNSTSAFAGVLMAVKRRHYGVDDAFRVRANVGKPGTGTEVRFDVNSPWIKDIKVLRRNEGFRREKLYYIRRSDKYLSGVQAAIRNAQPAQSASPVPTPAKKGGKKSRK